MHSSANSDHSPYSSKTKLFHIEFSDFHVSKGDSIKPWCDQLKRQLFEAEYLADEDSVFVPADVAATVHLSQKETLRVRELRQLAWQSGGAGVVEPRWDLVVQSLMRAFVVENVAEVIEAALVCAKGCRRRFRRVLFQRPMHPLMPTRFVAVGLLECAHVLAAGHTTSGCSISSLALSFRAPQDGCLARSAKRAFSIGSSVAWEQLCGRRLRSRLLPAPSRCSD
jgi:hypothetical protein